MPGQRGKATRKREKAHEPAKAASRQAKGILLDALERSASAHDSASYPPAMGGEAESRKLSNKGLRLDTM